MQYDMIFDTFWQYSIHVCRNGQVRALTYGKIMSMNLNAIDFWID